MQMVVVLIGAWNGTFGVLQGSIPGTDWYNVLVRPDLRLALRPGEFALVSK